MLQIKVEGLDAVIKKLDKLARNDLAFVAAKSLTNIAQEAKKGLQSEMDRIFNNPTPFTKNSIYIKPATKTNLVAEVGIKDQAVKYLMPQVTGGSRTMKRSERYLGSYWTPGAGMKLNKYGNVTSGRITQILSVLGKNPDPYSWTTARSRKRNKNLPNLFVIKTTGRNLRPGVWQKVGGKVKPLLMFIKQPTYRVRYHFYEVAVKIAEARWTSIFIENLKAVINKG